MAIAKACPVPIIAQAGLLPWRRKRGRRAGIYARFSTRYQHSVEDQIRSCQEFADRDGLTVNKKHLFADQAERGCKRRREGFQRLQEALAAGEIDVVLIFATSRLYRKTYRSLQFVEEELVGQGIRCVFVAQNIDSADESNWSMLMQLYALLDEQGVRMNIAYIQAAHQGLLINGMVHGTVTFGYDGEPVSGQQTRRDRPRRRLIICPKTAPWVRRVFEWFVVDGLHIDQIVKKLNDEGAPLPPRCTTGRWSHQAVVRLLSNPRYRGLWFYGETQSIWLGKADYCRQIPRDEPLRMVQLDGLRIVRDAVWFKAKELLEKNLRHHRRYWKKETRGDRPTLLNGLFRCPVHQQQLHVGGSHGTYYFCPVCKRSNSPALYSMLRRDLATRLICEQVAAAIRQDDDFVEQAIASCREQAKTMQEPDPERLAELTRRIESLGRKIKFILDAAGETAEDQEEDRQHLRSFRSDRARLQAEQASLRDAANRKISVPSSSEVRELLDNLASILHKGADSKNEERVARARQIIDEVTGGSIDVTQMGERRRHRGWARATLECRVLSTVVDRLTGVSATAGDGTVIVEIDFRESDRAEQIADEVKQLWDQGLLIREIAYRVGANRNLANMAALPSLCASSSPASASV